MGAMERSPSVRRGWAVGLGLILAGGTMACGGPAPERDRLVAVATPYLTTMPIFIAEAEGFFEEQELDVEFRPVARVAEIMTAVANGHADLTTSLVTVNELGLAAAGVRVRMVSTIGELQPGACSYLGILARREHLESGALDDPERIRQMRFDFSSLLPFGYFLDRHLADYELSTADIESVDMPPAAALELLPRGDIDVTMDSEPYLSRHLATGDVVLWRGVDELVPGYPSSFVIFGPRLLDERPDIGERAMVAILKGMRQFREGKTARNIEIVAEATGLEPALLEQTCWPTMSADAHIDPAMIRPYQEWSVAHGLVDRVLEDDQLFENRFIEHANRELGP